MFPMHRRRFATLLPLLVSWRSSLAGLLDYANDKPVLTERAISRLIKMSQRAIGEMCLGWKRSADPADLMYAPIMGLGDLDRIGHEHKPEPLDKPSRPQEPVRAPNSV